MLHTTSTTTYSTKQQSYEYEQLELLKNQYIEDKQAKSYHICHCKHHKHKHHRHHHNRHHHHTHHKHKHHKHSSDKHKRRHHKHRSSSGKKRRHHSHSHKKKRHHHSHSRHHQRHHKKHSSTHLQQPSCNTQSSPHHVNSKSLENIKLNEAKHSHKDHESKLTQIEEANKNHKDNDECETSSSHTKMTQSNFVSTTSASTMDTSSPPTTVTRVDLASNLWGPTRVVTLERIPNKSLGISIVGGKLDVFGTVTAANEAAAGATGGISSSDGCDNTLDVSNLKESNIGEKNLES